jgi:hypothetical protein
MNRRHYPTLAIALFVLSVCAAAPAPAAAQTPPKPPAKPQAQPQEDPAPVLSVPQGFRYDPQGRRDPFVNPVPKVVAPPPEIPPIRPEGLPGVLVAEAKVAGIVTSKEPGMTKVIISAPGRKTYFAMKGDTLFDGIIKEIRANEVVFTMISPSTKRPVDREAVVRTGSSAGNTAGEKK